jgi:hypothetical protein
MYVNAPTRQPSTGRRAGHAVAAIVNVVLLYLINVRPGWTVVPFLTADMTRVLPLVNVSLAVGVVLAVACLIHPAPWLVACGDVLTTGIGLAVLARLWQVFPFDFGPGSEWTVLTRVVLLLAIAGCVVAVPVHITRLTRAIRRDGRAG